MSSIYISIVADSDVNNEEEADDKLESPVQEALWSEYDHYVEEGEDDEDE